jgi:hypothetical protein
MRFECSGCQKSFSGSGLTANLNGKEQMYCADCYWKLETEYGKKKSCEDCDYFGNASCGKTKKALLPVQLGVVSYFVDAEKCQDFSKAEKDRAFLKMQMASEMFKQPLGLILISFPWFIVGVYNVFVGLSNASIEVQNIGIYGLSSLNELYQFAVVIYIALSATCLLVGLAQIVTVYGFWSRKSWSYKSGVTLPIVATLTSGIQYLLLTSLGYSGVSIALPIGNLIGATIVILYLRKDNVKRWLNYYMW